MPSPWASEIPCAWTLVTSIYEGHGSFLVPYTHQQTSLTLFTWISHECQPNDSKLMIAWWSSNPPKELPKWYWDSYDLLIHAHVMQQTYRATYPGYHWKEPNKSKPHIHPLPMIHTIRPCQSLAASSCHSLHIWLWHRHEHLSTRQVRWLSDNIFAFASMMYGMMVAGMLPNHQRDIVLGKKPTVLFYGKKTPWVPCSTVLNLKNKQENDGNDGDLFLRPRIEHN